jgi:hypothetical protein
MRLSVRRFVERRARGCCEYCQVSQIDRAYPYHIEHIIARQHDGSDAVSNLCYACRECNAAKGPNLAGYWRGQIVPLFNPRRQRWNRHFRWKGPRLVGRTLVGKITIKVLDMNNPDRLALRAFLIAQDRFPPA